MKTLKYSIFKYKTGKEKRDIILGILFSNESGTQKCFKSSKKINSDLDKDDEVDFFIIEKLVESIEDEVAKLEILDIENYIKYFISDFHFNGIIVVEYTNFDEKVKLICNEIMK